MEVPRQSSPILIMKDQKQPENVEYFNYLGNVITNAARFRREIKSWINMAKVAFNKNNNTGQQRFCPMRKNVCF
jgi:hypothetical protein